MNLRGRRVLIVAEFNHCNGGENSLLAVLPRLQSLGWNFELLAPEGEFARRMQGCGWTHHAVNWKANGQTLPLEQRRQIFHEAVEAIQPQIVHANSLAMARLTGPVCRQLGVASMGYLRDIVRLSPQSIRDLADHRRLIAVSNATRTFHLQQGLSSSLVRVIYNGIDVSPDKLPWNKTSGVSGFTRESLPNGSFIIGGVGQIGLRKGWDLFVAAAKIVAPVVKNSQWVIAGTRHSKKAETVAWEHQLRQQTAEPPLRGRFHWLDRVDAMPTFYRSLDLFIHPARQEPFGRAILEAAISGTPIVATDVGGTREMFPSIGNAVQLCGTDDPNALAEAIIGLHRDPHLASQRAGRARLRVSTVFTTKRCADAIDEVYREVGQT